jgi:hypothetical protein
LCGPSLGAVSLTAVQLAAIALGVALAIGQACLVGSLSGRHRSLGSARLIAVAFAIAPTAAGIVALAFVSRRRLTVAFLAGLALIAGGLRL